VHFNFEISLCDFSIDEFDAFKLKEEHLCFAVNGLFITQ
jgi:hypothetical protein